MTGVDWDAWLREWNRELLARYDPSRYDAFVDQALTGEIARSGWLGAPGASPTELGSLEQRIGATLPPSYRTFLMASNGFLQPGMIVPRLLRTDEISWFRDVDQETIDDWRRGWEAAGGDTRNDDDPVLRYLPSALVISEREMVGTARYLLNPKVVKNGEWEALVFAHWIPGFNRYPSFRALMEGERRLFASM